MKNTTNSTALFGTWLPFDTVPRSTACDRDAVLLCGPNGIVTAYWDSYEWVPDAVECTYDMAECRLDIGKPTHWMPLPSLPNSCRASSCSAALEVEMREAWTIIDVLYMDALDHHGESWPRAREWQERNQIFSPHNAEGDSQSPEN